MKNTALFILIIIFIESCSSAKKEQSSVDSSAVKLNGIWTEDWRGTGETVDVTYTDTIQIKFVDSKIVMKCINNSNYLYSEIFFDGAKFNFRMENVIDPKEEFLIYYKLKIGKDPKSMEGPVKNSRHHKDYAMFKKIGDVAR